jgi:hypothetical protein
VNGVFGFSAASPLSRFSRARSVVTDICIVSATASSTRLVSPSVVTKANSV